MISNRIITLILAVAALAPLATGGETDYKPQIHGVLRTRWEAEFGNEFAQRFQVRNARLSVSGNVLPTLSYRIQIDGCDRGKIKILDAYARWGFAGNWRVQAGQFRVPYAVDCFRGPGSYYFANRSFMAKHMLNMRAVGAMIGYYGGQSLPFTLEGGVFNSTAIGNHDTWQRNMNYAAKATYKIKNTTLAVSYISADPDSVRMNLIDGAVTWQAGRWIVEGEYQNKHYTNSSHTTSHGWNLFASYAMPLDNLTFNQLSFQARYDGMTDHSTGKRNDEGNLITDNPTRQRITIGTTLAFVKNPFKAAIRLNYEKYFYTNGLTAPQGEADKIVAELVVKF